MKFCTLLISPSSQEMGTQHFILCFYEFHSSKIPYMTSAMQYLSFSVWLILLRIMSLVLSYPYCSQTSGLPSSLNLLHTHTHTHTHTRTHTHSHTHTHTISHIIYSSITEHLGCFHSWSTVHNSAMSIETQKPLWNTDLIFFGYISRSDYW